MFGDKRRVTLESKNNKNILSWKSDLSQTNNPVYHHFIINSTDFIDNNKEIKTKGKEGREEKCYRFKIHDEKIYNKLKNKLNK